MRAGAPGAQNGGLIGDINWSFDAAGLAYLQSLDPAITNSLWQSFVDRNYATSTNGFQANSLSGGTVTLWGVDQATLLSTAISGDNFNTATTVLGTEQA